VNSSLPSNSSSSSSGSSGSNNNNNNNNNNSNSNSSGNNNNNNNNSSGGGGGAATTGGTNINNTSLKVLEAYTRDVGRGIARIDYDTMDSLAVSTGDVVEIRGKRRTTAKCLPLYPSDEGKGIIRIDGLVRNNSGIAIGDKIFIRKIKAVPAEKIFLSPLEAIPPIDERYLADALESVPIIKGDNVMVPYFGGRLTFQVIGVTPANADAVLVTQKTIFHIAEKGETLRGGGVPQVAYEDIGG
jgi:transitional endoplasmic reticulum ATPase